MKKTKRAEVTYRTFLSEPENIEIAVEVFNHFKEVQSYLQENYWREVKRFAENHKRHGEFGRWKVTEDGGGPADRHYGIAFDPCISDQSLYCHAYLQQGEPGRRFPLSLGIVWSEETPRAKEPDLVELRTLRNYLTEERKMRRPTHNWWIAREELGCELHSDEILTQLAKDKRETIQVLHADGFVQLFLDTRKMVERLNAKLAKSSR